MRRALFVGVAVGVVFDGASAVAQWNAHRRRRATQSTSPKSSEGVVNLNDASEDELARLPGSARARRARSRSIDTHIRFAASTS